MENNEFKKLISALDFDNLTPQQDQELTLLNDYKTVFEGEKGQAILEHLKSMFFVYDTTKGMTDAETNYNEGMRYVVLFISEQVKKANMIRR